MVVWENGRMKKSDYRKFIIRRRIAEFESSAMACVVAEPGSPRQNDDFASMREAVTRRYRRVLEEKKPMPSLILIDGGIGQLHAAAAALESLQIINQPLASIAKKEEILYVFGQENDPCILDRHSPVLHLIQQIRDETHRFAVTFHRDDAPSARPKPRSAMFPASDPDRAKTSSRIRQRRKYASRRRGQLESR